MKTAVLLIYGKLKGIWMICRIDRSRVGLFGRDRDEGLFIYIYKYIYTYIYTYMSISLPMRRGRKNMYKSRHWERGTGAAFVLYGNTAEEAFKQ